MSHTPSSDPLLVRAMRGETVERTPVWFMRQAGRSLPEYRALRKAGGLLEMCHDPETAAEVTMQPVRRGQRAFERIDIQVAKYHRPLVPFSLLRLPNMIGEPPDRVALIVWRSSEFARQVGRSHQQLTWIDRQNRISRLLGEAE